MEDYSINEFFEIQDSAGKIVKKPVKIKNHAVFDQNSSVFYLNNSVKQPTFFEDLLNQEQEKVKGSLRLTICPKTENQKDCYINQPAYICTTAPMPLPPSPTLVVPSSSIFLICIGKGFLIYNFFRSFSVSFTNFKEKEKKLTLKKEELSDLKIKKKVTGFFK